jgi:predicted nucleic-acid-binding protein
MKIVDANIILRYMLNDVEALAERAAVILENEDVFIPNEVIAEVVYVLEKVYRIERTEIRSSLLMFLEYNTVQFHNQQVISVALELYAEKRFDFVDTLLYAYSKVMNYTVFTFDDKLNRALQQI